MSQLQVFCSSVVIILPQIRLCRAYWYCLFSVYIDTILNIFSVYFDTILNRFKVNFDIILHRLTFTQF
jgi:hypothetical protein